MSLPILNLNARQAIINNDYGQWGVKINNIQQELADGINELYDDILEINGVSSGLGLKQDKTDNLLNTTSKTIVGAINEHESDLIALDGRVDDLELNDKVRVYDTVAEMQADSGNISEGMTVQLLGYYTKNDGAGHYRKIEATDDGSGIPVGGLWANIIYDNFINLKWFGCKGDNIKDDTILFQKCLNFFGSKNIDIYNSGKHKGGIIFLPRGIYKITDTLNINENTSLIGEVNFSWFKSEINTFESGSIIDGSSFLDTEKVLIQAIPIVKSTGLLYNYGNPIAGSLVLSGTAMDSGNYTFKDNIKISNISLTTNNNLAVGFAGIGTTNIRLSNVSFSGFRNSAILSSSWGGSADKIFSSSSHTGFNIMDACNGFSLRDSYITHDGSSLEYNASNKILTGNIDYLDSTPYAKTGTLSEYCQSLILDNVIYEKFDRGIRHKNNNNVTFNNLYLELIKNLCIDSLQNTFKISNPFIFCSNATFINSNGLDYGVVELFHPVSILKISSGNNDGKIKFLNSTNIESSNFTNGIEVFDYENIYVDSVNGSDSNSGISEAYPVKNLLTAINRVKENGNVFLKKDSIFDINGLIINKNLNFYNFGTGSIPILNMYSVDNYLYGIYTTKNLKFTNVSIKIPTKTTVDASARQGFSLQGLNPRINFIGCTIDIGSNVCLFQSHYGSCTDLKITYNQCSIIGNGFLSLPPYANYSRLVVTDISFDSTINTTVKTNGYNSALILHSDILS